MDHVDPSVAAELGATVTEVTFCDPISVAKRVAMLIITLRRNYSPSHHTFFDGGWNIADCGHRADDVECVSIGTVASGHIGLAVRRRLYPFDVD